MPARDSAGLPGPVDSGLSWRPPPGSEGLGGNQRTTPPLRSLHGRVNSGITPVGVWGTSITHAREPCGRSASSISHFGPLLGLPDNRTHTHEVTTIRPTIAPDTGHTH